MIRGYTDLGTMTREQLHVLRDRGGVADFEILHWQMRGEENPPVWWGCRRFAFCFFTGGVKHEVRAISYYVKNSLAAHAERTEEFKECLRIIREALSEYDL